MRVSERCAGWAGVLGVGPYDVPNLRTRRSGDVLSQNRLFPRGLTLLIFASANACQLLRPTRQ